MQPSEEEPTPTAPQTASTAPPEPTPLTDPHGYLALFKFNRKLPRCPRTGLPVSYSDIGDPDGVPVLFVPPSGCSRWFSAPQDPLANGYGLRLITVDRPGVGAVPMVPLEERIETSCKLIVSVLEHLDVRPAHMLATSAGVYCALRLLSAYPDIFLTGLTPPPFVYFISPWSPPLPASHPLAYRQMLDWVPDRLITTQDLTLPYLVPAVKSAEEAYGATTKAVGAAVGALKSWWVGTPRSTTPTQLAKSENEDSDSPVASETQQDAPESEPPKRPRLWAPSAKYLTMDYLYAEDFRGIGQEHMLCLNRGPIDTGPEWFTTELAAVAKALRTAQVGADGGEDGERDREAEPASQVDMPGGTEEEAEDLKEDVIGGKTDQGEDAEDSEKSATESTTSTSTRKGAPNRVKPLPNKLDLRVWWGMQDGMVPRNGQEWLNKALAAHPAEISLSVQNVEDGDHSDLMLRAQGIGEVYAAVMAQGASTDSDAGGGWEDI